MRKILIIVYSAFLLIVIANYIYYKSLYNKQISYIIELLDRQVQIVGISVDSTNNGFLSDLNQISFTEDLSLFFTNHDWKYNYPYKLIQWIDNLKSNTQIALLISLIVGLPTVLWNICNFSRIRLTNSDEKEKKIKNIQTKLNEMNP